MSTRILCYASSSFCTLTTSSLAVSDPELKTCRSALLVKIGTASNNAVLDTRVEICVVRFLLHRHLTKNINAIIHNAGAALLP